MAAAVDLLIYSATVVYLRLTKLANAENWKGSIHECAVAVFLSAKKLVWCCVVSTAWIVLRYQQAKQILFFKLFQLY